MRIIIMLFSKRLSTVQNILKLCPTSFHCIHFNNPNLHCHLLMIKGNVSICLYIFTCILFVLYFRFILKCGIHSRPYGSYLNEIYQDNCIKTSCIENDCETTSMTTDNNMIVDY